MSRTIDWDSIGKEAKDAVSAIFREEFNQWINVMKVGVADRLELLAKNTFTFAKRKVEGDPTAEETLVYLQKEAKSIVMTAGVSAEKATRMAAIRSAEVAVRIAAKILAAAIAV